MRGDMAQPSIKSPAEDGGNPKLYDLFMHELSLYAYLPGHFEKRKESCRFKFIQIRLRAWDRSHAFFVCHRMICGRIVVV